MNRDEILELLLKDKSHDELIERPELYSIEEDIYQWMFETRDYWNEKIPKIIESERRDYEELKRDEPEYYWQYETKYDTEENHRKHAYRYYRRWRGFKRGSLHWKISWFWRSLLTKRPEFANRCPWHSFRGDQIWWALGDDEFCNAIGIPKKELAMKMPLKIMSRCDWEELLKIAPELQPEYDRQLAMGYKFDAYYY